MDVWYKDVPSSKTQQIRNSISFCVIQSGLGPGGNMSVVIPSGRAFFIGFKT
jgi:hypothetical protein